jgi:hypothetical protein
MVKQLLSCVLLLLVCVSVVLAEDKQNSKPGVLEDLHRGLDSLPGVAKEAGVAIAKLLGDKAVPLSKDATEKLQDHVDAAKGKVNEKIEDHKESIAQVNAAVEVVADKTKAVSDHLAEQVATAQKAIGAVIDNKYDEHKDKLDSAQAVADQAKAALGDAQEAVKARVDKAHELVKAKVGPVLDQQLEQHKETVSKVKSAVDSTVNAKDKVTTRAEEEMKKARALVNDHKDKDAREILLKFREHTKASLAGVQKHVAAVAQAIEEKKATEHQGPLTVSQLLSRFAHQALDKAAHAVKTTEYQLPRRQEDGKEANATSLGVVRAEEIVISEDAAAEDAPGASPAPSTDENEEEDKSEEDKSEDSSENFFGQEEELMKHALNRAWRHTRFRHFKDVRRQLKDGFRGKKGRRVFLERMKRPNGLFNPFRRLRGGHGNPNVASATFNTGPVVDLAKALQQAAQRARHDIGEERVEWVQLPTGDHPFQVDVREIVHH